MKKLKIYLDTSVISHLDQQDAPEKMADTLAFWEKVKAGVFEVFLSTVDMEEIERCDDEKLSRLRNYLKEINFSYLEKSEEAESLAQLYVQSNVLTAKNIDDCRHIAYACVSYCNAVVSWNFKHIVNHNTIVGVKSVNAIAGYNEMAIYTPPYLTNLMNKEDL